MTPERRNLLIGLGVAVGLVAALLLVPRLREELAPEPRTGWVAIEAEGSGEAVIGPVELAAGTSFRLHAVLEAVRRDGSTLYYTEAPALRAGGERVAAEDLAPWDRPQEVRVLWFTVEGARPYLELGPGDGLDRFRTGEFLRADWPQTWSVPGRLDPANGDSMARDPAAGPLPFGTQRYHVRIELYGPESRFIPERRYTSWAAAEAASRPREFPTVTASLPGPIGPASALFGLTQIEPAAGADGELLRSLRELTRERRAFSRLTALAALLDAAGRTVGDLRWSRVSLDGEVRWAEGEGAARPGDLLRVGDRVVVLYRDEGEGGLLDRTDLCFDFARGAAVRPLAEVFTGGGVVELAALG